MGAPAVLGGMPPKENGTRQHHSEPNNDLTSGQGTGKKRKQQQSPDQHNNVANPCEKRHPTTLMQTPVLLLCCIAIEVDCRGLSKAKMVQVMQEADAAGKWQRLLADSHLRAMHEQGLAADRQNLSETLGGVE